MLNRTIILLFFVLIAISFVGGSCCHKDPIPETYYIPNEVLDYVHFDKGSWWKYVETSSGEIDSVPVTTSKLTVTTYGNLQLQKEWLDIFLKGDTYRYGVYYYSDTDNPPDQFEIYEGDETHSCITFFYCTYDCDTNPSIPYPEALGTREDLDSLEIQGVMYSDVVHISNLNAYPNGLVTEVWYARHVGVIKRKFLDGTDWEIIDHSVTQTF